MSSNFYVDLHVLQTVPPSCVNRDDTNSPKTAMYGGTQRARVSSQAWKHAMRGYFTDLFSEEELAKRTKHIVELVEKEILVKRPDLTPEKIDKDVMALLKKAGLPVNEKKKTSDTLCFLSKKQAEALAECYLDRGTDEKEYKNKLNKAVKENPSVDMALFGRMVASDPSLNYDAAAQVAHAISTHEVHTEYDYFTAVDDCAPDDNAGAGHLGTVEFNSSTLYRYATINVNQLYEYLGDETGSVVGKFAKAFILSMPTGKQNTFANRTVPDFVYVTIRADQPVSLCGAFEKAISPGKDGFVEKSEKSLLDYADHVYADFVEKPLFEGIVGGEKIGKEGMNLSDLLAALERKVRDHLSSSDEVQ